MVTVSVLTFPASRVNQFRFDPNSGLRWGQSFYDFMQLDKCTQDREFCDKLYNATDETAKDMVRDRIDTNN